MMQTLAESKHTEINSVFLGQVQKRTIKMTNGLEHFSFEKA